MKKLCIFILVVTALFSSSVAAFGLNSPENKGGHGVFTSMYATEDLGPIMGLEYGLTDKFAILGEASLGDAEYKKMELKYEIDRTFGLVGGVYSTDSDDNLFIGVNGAVPLTRKFIGILELDGVMVDGFDDMYALYEVGAKYYLNKSFNIRGGVRGTTEDGTSNAYELGIGIQF
jgi:hypothetical protein